MTKLEKSPHIPYQGEIDGLRAIAILALLGFHAGLGFKGGYIGIDTSFVITGYLITKLILHDIDHGHFNILDFWERRIRRIFPALTCVMLVSLVAGWILFFPGDFKELGQSVFARALLISNLYFSRMSGFWAHTANYRPLLHTWPLSLVEQFYILYPCLVVVACRFSRNSFGKALLVVGGASLGLCVFRSYHPPANFFYLPTRGWELLMGAWLAAIPTGRAAPRWVLELVSAGGLLAILYAIFSFNNSTRSPGAATVLPCAGAACVIWANRGALTATGRILAAPPLVFIDSLSYSLYLWHWPLFVFFQNWALVPLTTAQRLMLLLLTLILAFITWKWVETPVRIGRVFKRRSQVFAFATVSTVALALAGLIIHRFDGLPGRLPPAVVHYLDARNDHPPFENVELKDAVAGDFIEVGAGEKHRPIEFLLWGDTHATSVMPALDYLCTVHGTRGVAAIHSGIPPLVGYHSHWTTLQEDEIQARDRAIIAFIGSQHVRNVLLVARWDEYVLSDKVTDRLHHSLLATLNELRNAGANAWILRQVPIQTCDVPLVLATASFHGHDPEVLGLPLNIHLETRRLQDPIFEGAPAAGAAILDPTDYLVNSSSMIPMARGGDSLYTDNTHLSVTGAMLLRPLFDPIFNGAR